MKGIIQLLIALSPIIVVLFNKIFSSAAARERAKKDTERNASTAATKVAENVASLEEEASNIESAADKW